MAVGAGLVPVRRRGANFRLGDPKQAGVLTKIEPPCLEEHLE